MPAPSSFRKLVTAIVLALAVVFGSSHARAADPTTADCLNANEKSIQLRAERKFRAARAELLSCAAESCPADIRNECTRRVAELNLAMPTVVFEVKGPTGSDVSDVRVTMDGATLVERLEGTGLSIDPGKHAFVFEAEGQPSVAKDLVILEGVKNRRERIVIGTNPATAPQVAQTDQLGAVDSDSAQGRLAKRAKIERIAGWTLGGVGVVGLGLGAVFEAQRGSTLSTRNAVCPSRTDCEPGSQARINDLTSQARTASTLGVVSLVAGGAFIAGGIVTLFIAHKTDPGPAEHDAARLSLVPLVSPAFQGVVLDGQVW